MMVGTACYGSNDDTFLRGDGKCFVSTLKIREGGVDSGGDGGVDSGGDDGDGADGGGDGDGGAGATPVLVVVVVEPCYS